MSKFKSVWLAEAHHFLASFAIGTKPEEQSVDAMEALLLARTSKPEEISVGDHWEVWIGVFFEVIKNSKREQIDMFDTLLKLVRFSNPLTREGTPFWISTGECYSLSFFLLS